MLSPPLNNPNCINIKIQTTTNTKITFIFRIFLLLIVQNSKGIIRIIQNSIVTKAKKGETE